MLADNFKKYSTKQYLKITVIVKLKIQVKQENWRLDSSDSPVSFFTTTPYIPAVHT